KAASWPTPNTPSRCCAASKTSVSASASTTSAPATRRSATSRSSPSTSSRSTLRGWIDGPEKGDQLRLGVNSHLPKNGGEVVPDRALAHEHLGGHRWYPLTPQKACEDLRLAVRQLTVGRQPGKFGLFARRGKHLCRLDLCGDAP